MTIRYDNKRKAWIFDDIGEVTGAMFNNLLKWGQACRFGLLFLSVFALLQMLPSHSNADLVCRWDNIFEEDLSHLVRDKIHWDKSAGTISFTDLGEDWREVCLLAMSEGGYDTMGGGYIRFIEGVLGKEICRWNAREVIAFVYDHSDHVLQLSLTEMFGMDSPGISTDYKYAKPPDGYSQCSPIADAVARCVPDGSIRYNRCIFLFDEKD
ncbi:hypothetical protein [Nitratireductor sp. XY-223]|uniref:hypothetical protein n=1 Tax=Nitratireductor sp. XY-223 TaxID=2561926 RepID=UPI0010A9AD67|nr:hypothetical protein [Nitratireductor sp. XY-223]